MREYMILDGKTLSETLQNNMKLEIDELKSYNIFPHLCVLLVGENPASVSYVNMKARACERVGIQSSIIKFSDDISESEILLEIARLNNDKSVNGILVQLPLPKHINTDNILEAVDIDKDVDGFHPYNIGRLYEDISYFIPATPLGIMMLLKHYDIDPSGKNVVIVGASNIVGKPLAALMLNAGATITLCHILTKDLKSHTLNADILCVGVGKVNLITADMIKEGAIVVDIGINKLNGKIVGDVDFNNVAKKASFITPVPGGAGPMTITALLSNTIKAAKIYKGNK